MEVKNIMHSKDIVIIALIILVVCSYYYQQQNQPNISNNGQEIHDLKQQIQHYQTLYQKRVEKDLSLEQEDEETQTEDEQLITQHQEQLRKINVLFDEKAKDYQFIDFNSLYSNLSQIAERERERERATSANKYNYCPKSLSQSLIQLISKPS
ncbi:MAG: hypothetical protein NY202_00435 [Mollicutes bacterium UO1]